MSGRTKRVETRSAQVEMKQVYEFVFGKPEGKKEASLGTWTYEGG